MVDGRGTAEVVFRLKAEHCGVVSIVGSDVRVKDYLGLFCRAMCRACFCGRIYLAASGGETGEDEETRTPGKSGRRRRQQRLSAAAETISRRLGDIREYQERRHAPQYSLETVRAV